MKRNADDFRKKNMKAPNKNPIVGQTSEESIQLDSDTDTENYLINKKRGTMLIPNINEIKGDEEIMDRKEFEDLIDKAFIAEEKKKTFFAGTTCCLFFLVSSFLWVILFSNLTQRNTRVSNIVMDLPNAEELHQQYTRLYKLFDKNRNLL